MAERDYSRLAATAFARDRVEGLTVLVIGAGALGNEVIKNLALLGVGTIWILDRDHVELSNLTRSVLFCVPDIATHLANRTPKAKLAAHRAREINPDVAATGFLGEVADFGLGFFRRADIVFACLDNEMARLELSWTCTRANKPLVDGGLGTTNYSSGQVVFFPGAEGPCYACRKSGAQRSRLLQELQGREDPCWLKERASEDVAMITTTPLMASIVGAFQVEVGLRAVLGDARPADAGTAYRIVLHPAPLLEPIAFARSPNCPLHDPQSVLREVEERPVCADACTPADLLAGDASAAVSFDWPLAAQASCHACSHAWEPLVRRARFRNEQCPKCGSADVVELEVLTSVSADSPWAQRTFASLGLPRGSVFEIVTGPDMDAPRRHVELTGDLAAVRQVSVA